MTPAQTSTHSADTPFGHSLRTHPEHSSRIRPAEMGFEEETSRTQAETRSGNIIWSLVNNGRFQALVVQLVQRH